MLATESLQPELERLVGDLDGPWPLLVIDGALEDAAERVEAALTRGEGVVVIARTPAEAAEALAAGATDAVTWPADRDLLVARLKRAWEVLPLPWLRALHALVEDSVEFADTQARLRDVNPAFERITGYDRAEVIGRTTGELFRAGHHDPEYYRQIPRALESEGVWRGALTARRQDGSLSFQQATIAEARDDRGRVVGHLGIKRDVSRDDLARMALAGAEARTRVLLDRAAEAVMVHGLDGALVDVNRSACEMLGMSRAELLERRIFDFDVGATADDHARRWQGLGAEPAIVASEWRRADGSTFPVELSLGRTELVGTTFVLVVARDITELRRAQRELQRVNEELTHLTQHLEEEVASRTVALRDALAQRGAILDSLVDGLLAVSPDGAVEVANRALAQMLRVDVEALHGAPADALHPDLGRLARTAVAARCVHEGELELPGRRVGHVAAAPILVGQGDEQECIGGVLLVRDVTHAREVDRMKTEFTATVSHELRTPLTSILGFAKLVRSRLEGVVFPKVDTDDRRVRRAMEQISGNLGIVAAEGERLSALIGDVLDISKMEAGRVDWRSDPIVVADLVDRALAATASLFSSGGPAPIRDVRPGLPKILGDPDRLLQVLINLISNAAKFTDEGSITVAARRSSEGVEFSVTDTGLGIPEADHVMIFEKFKQSGDTLTGRPPGTGLGLPICRHIVEHHGGAIGVDSAPGRGSRFWFALPARPLTGEIHPGLGRVRTRVLAQVEELAAAAEGVAPEVLVVDDDHSVRELLRQLLESAGYRVRLAADGFAAVEAVRGSRPDLMVLDVMMPGISGFDVVAMLRADPATRELPIVILSILHDRETGLRLGVDRYLTKPLDPAALLGALRALTRRTSPPRRVLVATADGTAAGEIGALLEGQGSEVVGWCALVDAVARAQALEPSALVVVADDVRAAEALGRAFREEPELERVPVMALVDSGL